MSVRATWSGRREYGFAIGTARDVRCRLLEPLRINREGDRRHRRNDSPYDAQLHTNLPTTCWTAQQPEAISRRMSVSIPIDSAASHSHSSLKSAKDASHESCRLSALT